MPQTGSIIATSDLPFYLGRDIRAMRAACSGWRAASSGPWASSKSAKSNPGATVQPNRQCDDSGASSTANHVPAGITSCGRAPAAMSRPRRAHLGGARRSQQQHVERPAFVQVEQLVGLQPVQIRRRLRARHQEIDRRARGARAPVRRGVDGQSGADTSRRKTRARGAAPAARSRSAPVRDPTWSPQFIVVPASAPAQSAARRISRRRVSITSGRSSGSGAPPFTRAASARSRPSSSAMAAATAGAGG